MNRKMYTINVATNARKEPSTNGELITTVMPGTVLDVIDETYYDHEGNVLEEPWYLTKYGWMCDIYGNTITGDTLGNCFLEVDTDKFDYKFSVLADPYYQKGKTIHQMTYFKDTEAVKDGYKLATITNGALYYEYDGKYYSNGLEVSTGTNNQDVTMTAVSDYLNCGAIYSTGTFNGLPVNIGRYESWMNSLVPQTIDNALSGCLIRLGGQTVYDNKDTYRAQWNSASDRTIWYVTTDSENRLFIGTIMMKAATIDEAIRVCDCLKIDSAIVMDGGGSCFRILCDGTEDVKTTRSVKSAMALYYKEKGAEPEPEPQPSELETRVATLEEDIKDTKMRLDKLERIVDVLDIDVTKLYETMKELHHTLEGY